MTGWKKTLAAALLGCPALQAGATTLNVTPVSNPSTVGQIVTLNVSLADVQYLVGYHFDVAYNPAVVQPDHVWVNPFMGTGTRAFYTEGAVDDQINEIIWISGLMIGSGIAPFSGSELLAQVSFRTVGTGNSGISLNDVELYNPAYNGIPFGLNVTQVQVNAIAAAVPEPATWLMLAAGLAGVAALRRRKAA